MRASEVRVKDGESGNDIVDQHAHLYIVAILLSILKLSYTYAQLADNNIFKIDQPNIIFFIEFLSIPLSVINPSAWFAAFMTSLAVLCASTGYPTFSIITVFFMYLTLYISEFWKTGEKAKKKKNSSVKYFKLDSQPLVDKKLIENVI